MINFTETLDLHSEIHQKKNVDDIKVINSLLWLQQQLSATGYNIIQYCNSNTMMLFMKKKLTCVIVLPEWRWSLTHQIYHLLPSYPFHPLLYVCQSYPILSIPRQQTIQSHVQASHKNTSVGRNIIYESYMV